MLGSEVLRGKFGEACSLLMKGNESEMVFSVDLPSLETFTFSTSSLLNVNQVSLTSRIGSM